MEKALTPLASVGSGSEKNMAPQLSNSKRERTILLLKFVQLMIKFFVIGTKNL